MTNLIDSLDREWDRREGFFGRLRNGDYSDVAFNRVFDLISGLELEAVELIDKRLVSLLWYAPLFMTWQRKRVMEKGGDLVAFDAATNRIVSLLEKKLGVP